MGSGAGSWEAESVPGGKREGEAYSGAELQFRAWVETEGTTHLGSWDADSPHVNILS